MFREAPCSLETLDLKIHFECSETLVVDVLTQSIQEFLSIEHLIRMSYNSRCGCFETLDWGVLFITTACEHSIQEYFLKNIRTGCSKRFETDVPTHPLWLCWNTRFRSIKLKNIRSRCFLYSIMVVFKHPKWVFLEHPIHPYRMNKGDERGSHITQMDSSTGMSYLQNQTAGPYYF